MWSNEPAHVQYGQLTMLIPVLNEAGAIAVLLKELNQLYPGLRVLVLDDGSSDGTDDVVMHAANLCGAITIEFVSRVGCRFHGITASVLDGLSRVTSEFVGVMDGDLQHPASVLGELAMMLGRADLVIASRTPYKENQGWHRILFTRLATKLAHIALKSRGYAISDPMSGFFVGRTALVAGIALARANRFEHCGYKVLFDLLMQFPRGVAIKQHCYQFAFREYGSSKLRLRHALYFLRSIARELLFRLPDVDSVGSTYIVIPKNNVTYSNSKKPNVK